MHARSPPEEGRNGFTAPGARSPGKLLGTLEVTLDLEVLWKCPSATRHRVQWPITSSKLHRRTRYHGSEYRIYDTRELWNCYEYCANL